jgi:hypothetical protein
MHHRQVHGQLQLFSQIESHYFYQSQSFIEIQNIDISTMLTSITNYKKNLPFVSKMDIVYRLF